MRVNFQFSSKNISKTRNVLNMTLIKCRIRFVLSNRKHASESVKFFLLSIVKYMPRLTLFKLMEYVQLKTAIITFQMEASINGNSMFSIFVVLKKAFRLLLDLWTSVGIQSNYFNIFQICPQYLVWSDWKRHSYSPRTENNWVLGLQWLHLDHLWEFWNIVEYTRLSVFVQTYPKSYDHFETFRTSDCLRFEVDIYSVSCDI